MTRALIAVAALALSVAACNGAFRFDDTARDGGGGTIGTGGAGSTSCPSGSCGWETRACDGGSCSLSCPPATTCVGTCGVSCSADCGPNSHCALMTGRSGSVSCDEGANCTFVLGESGSG